MKHYQDNLKNGIEKLKTYKKEFENFDGIKIEISNINIKDYSNQLLKEYREKFEIIKIPQDKTELFDEILEMSIQKYPPFKKGNSDQGFKDAIIFKSIKNFSKENNFEKYVIISSDEGFINQSEKLNKNFDDGELEIISHKEINSYIIKNFKLYGEIQKILEEKLIEKVENIYLKTSMIEINQEYKWIRRWSLKENETEIHKINENKFKVEIPILIEIDEDNSIPFLNLIPITQKEIYELKKRKWQMEIFWTSKKL